MKTSLNCARCIVDDVMTAGSLEGVDSKLLAKDVMNCLSEKFNTQTIPSVFITDVHRILKKIAGKNVLFKEEREKANDYGLLFAENIKNEKMEKLIEYAVKANGMDFRTAGIGYDNDPKEGIKKCEVKGNVKDVAQLLESSKSILYVLDNVGEICIDKVLIERLLDMGKKITCIAKKGAITSDAIEEDLRDTGFYDLPIDIIYSSSDSLGLMPEDKDLIDEVEKDIIISKGQANFYFFDEYDFKERVVFMFSVKCDVVGNYLGVKRGDCIVRFKK